MTSPSCKTKLAVIIAIVMTAVVSASAQGCVQPPDTTMVAWYSFDELFSTTSGDFASGNTGTQFGVPPGGSLGIPSGEVGVAASFNGSNQYVDSASSIANNFGPAGTSFTCQGKNSTCYGNFSIDTWVNIPLTAPHFVVMTILDKRTDLPGGGLVGYHMSVYKDLTHETFGLQLADDIGTPPFTSYSSNPLTGMLYGQGWHHIAVTVNRTSPTGIQFYFDGMPWGSRDPTLRPGSLVNSSPLRIGARTAALPLTGFFQGSLDELEIFNRDLTPTEVLNIFYAGTHGKVKPSNAWTISSGYAVSDAFFLSSVGHITNLDFVYWDHWGEWGLGSVEMRIGSTPFGNQYSDQVLIPITSTSLGLNCGVFQVHKASVMFSAITVPPGYSYITLQNAHEILSGGPTYWEQSSGLSAAYSNVGGVVPGSCAQPNPGCPPNLIPPESFRLQ